MVELIEIDCTIFEGMLQRGRHIYSDNRWSHKEAQLKRFLETDVSFRKIAVIEMDPKQQQLPRLTGALRAFGGVSSRLSREPVRLDEVQLKNKQARRKKESKQSQKSWNKASEEVVSQCSKQDSGKVSFWCAFFGVCTV